MAKVGVYVDIGSGKTFTRELGKEAFREVKRKDIQFAGGSGGRRARQSLEQIDVARQREAERKAKEKADTEAKRIAEEKRVAEAKRLADEKAKAEAKRLADEKAKKEAEIKRLQERYIASLRAKPGTDLEVQPYTGIKKPYGTPDITWQEPRFGTLGFGEKPFKDVSAFEILQEQERFDPGVSLPTEIIYQQEADRVINRIVNTETGKANANLKREQNRIQNKVDSGTISVDEANNQLINIQTSINDKLKKDVGSKFDVEFKKVETSQAFKTKIKRSERFRGELEKFDPEFIKERNKRRLETLLDVGAIVVSTVAPQVGIAYFGGKGISQAARGAKEDIVVIGDPSKGIPLYPELQPSPLSQEAGVSLLFGGISGVPAARGIGSQITRLRGKALKDTPWSITGRQIYQEGDKTFLKVSASKTTGVASAEAEMILPVKVGKGGRFNIQQGGGKS